MKSIDIEKIFKETGVKLSGHFELTSGLHSDTYFEKFRLLEHPKWTTIICKELVHKVKNIEFDRVAGPTTGGIILAYEVARQLNKKCIFAEKVPEGRDFLRGFVIKEGEKVLVVDDVLTTGSSVNDTIAAIKKRGAIVVGVAVIIDRSEKEINFGIPLFSLYKEKVVNFKPEECPLCKKEIKLTKPGGRR